jgi:hypothetical protein
MVEARRELPCVLDGKLQTVVSRCQQRSNSWNEVTGKRLTTLRFITAR